MKVHAVYPLSEREILTRELSCCCEEYMIHPSPVCNWQKHTLVLTPAALPVMPQNGNSDDDMEPADDGDRSTEDDTVEHIVMEDGTYVAAVYENQWYLGMVVEQADTDVF